MKRLKFSMLKKRAPFTAKKFFTEQEVLLVFLNVPARAKWLKFIGLSKKEIESINKIINVYAKKKVQLEKKLKPKYLGEVIKIEVSVLKGIFKGELLKFKGIVEKTDALRIAEKILKVKYPKSVILNMMETDKLATLAGINTLKNFPTDLLVFDLNENKIIGVNLILK
jgi:hypothetical protein